MKFFGYNAEDTAGDKAFELRETTIVTESIEEIDSLIEFLQFVKHSHLKVNRERENMHVHTHYRDWENALDTKGDLIIVTGTEKEEKESDPAYADIVQRLDSEEFYNLSETDKLKELLGYLDTSERDPMLAMKVADTVFYKLILPCEHKKPNILKACGRVLAYSDDPVLRRKARLMIAEVCCDNELEKYLEYYSPKEYNEAMEHRLFCRNEKEKAKEFRYGANIDSFIELILHTMRNIYDRKDDIACLKKGIKLTKDLGDGVVAPAWMSIYAYLHAELACDAAIEQNNDTAIEYLTKYIEINENSLHKIKDGDILSYGNRLLFGDLAEKAVLIREGDKPVVMTSVIHSRYGNVRHLSPACIFHPDSLLHYFNEEKSFFALHGDERFEALKKRAEQLADDWIKANE